LGGFSKKEGLFILSRGAPRSRSWSSPIRPGPRDCGEGADGPGARRSGAKGGQGVAKKRGEVCCCGFWALQGEKATHHGGGVLPARGGHTHTPEKGGTVCGVLDHTRASGPAERLFFNRPQGVARGTSPKGGPRGGAPLFQLVGERFFFLPRETAGLRTKWRDAVGGSRSEISGFGDPKRGSRRVRLRWLSNGKGRPERRGRGGVLPDGNPR